MGNEKKCPHCGAWSEWNLSMEDACQHCGELLQKAEVQKAKERDVLQKLQEKAFLFNINQDDNIIVRILKKGGYVVYLLIMSIATFLSWLLFWLGP